MLWNFQSCAAEGHEVSALFAGTPSLRALKHHTNEAMCRSSTKSATKGKSSARPVRNQAILETPDQPTDQMSTTERTLLTPHGTENSALLKFVTHES